MALNERQFCVAVIDNWIGQLDGVPSLSSDWPISSSLLIGQVNYSKVAEACNSARNGFDVEDSWTSVLSIVDQYGLNLLGFAEVAGPGFWNDPDMVLCV